MRIVVDPADVRTLQRMAEAVVQRLDAAGKAVYRPQREHHAAAARGITMSLIDSAREVRMASPQIEGGDDATS